jgi:Flp pilus assembly protein TadG
MSRVRRDDRGIAALELAIFTSVLLLLAFGALPLYAMGRGYQRVAKSSSSTLRYATSVASHGTRTGGGQLSRRPTYDEIAQFARDTANDQTLEVVVTVCKSGTCTDITTASPGRTSPIPATAGDTVKLTVSTSVDLSVLGRVANAASRMTGNGPAFPENDVAISATAAAREE